MNASFDFTDHEVAVFREPETVYVAHELNQSDARIRGRMHQSARTRSPGRVVTLAAAVVAAVLLAGCSGSGSGGGGGAGEGEVDRTAHFRIAYPVTQSLDPRDAADPGPVMIATWPVYDRLIQVTPEAEYVPMLATDWTFSAEGKTLTLKLREDVTFSDGTPFDAEAVKANLDDYRAAKGTLLQDQVAGISEVVVVDEHTVELKLAKPSTTVLNALSSTLGGIMISPKALKSGDLATKPVGTGAYVIESFQPGQEVTYTRRTDEGGIWDEKTGKPAKVTIRTMDSDAQVSAVKSGQVDLTVWSQSVYPFRAEIDAGQLTYTMMEGVLTMVGVSFNKTMPPFDDPLVRQAVNYAIDREAIVEAFMPDNEPRVQPWPNGLMGFEESREEVYSYDPEKAKELLAQAGHADGVDGGELLVPGAGALPQVAVVVQANLAEVGIDVKLRTTDVFSLVSQWPDAGATAQINYMSLPSIDSYSWLERLFVNPVWTIDGPSKEMAALIRADLDDPNLSSEETAALVGKAVDHATEEALYAPLWQGAGGFIATPQVNLDDVPVYGSVPDFRHVYLFR